MSRIIKSSQVRVVERVILNNESTGGSQTEDTNKSQVDSDNEYEQIIEIARKRAEYIVNEAILEAGTIKDNVFKDAEEQLEKLKEEAHKEAYEEGHEVGKNEGQSHGYDEGFQKGFNEGKVESDSLIEQANSIKREYLEEKEKTLSSIESDVINLVFSIVEKALNQKIEEDDDLIVDLVLKGLESLNSKDNIRIRVSKEDFEKVNDSKESILSKVSLIENLKVDIDSNLKKGDCFVESSKGNVDVSISTQIKNVEEELKSLLDSE